MVNGSLSPSTQVASGVPQGSVLGHLLLLYIDDLPEVLDCKTTSVRLFADDAIIYRPVPSFQDSQVLQDQLNKVANWANSWQLYFNVAKCSATSVQSILTNFKYHLEGSLVNATYSFADLAVNVSNTLLLNTHISRTVQKATSTLYMLMGALKGASCQYLLTFARICF